MCYQMTAESGPFTYDILQLARENKISIGYLNWMPGIRAQQYLAQAVESCYG